MGENLSLKLRFIKLNTVDLVTYQLLIRNFLSYNVCVPPG